MSKTAKWYINVAIMLCIMIFFRFIPAPSPITPTGMAAAGLFLGCIYGWITLSYMGPSLIALFLYGFLTGAGPAGAFAEVFSKPLVDLALWLMISVGILQTSNIGQWVAKWSITREFTRGKPWLLWAVIMLALMALASVINGIAALLIFWIVVQTMCTEVGYKKGDATPAFYTFCCVLFSTTASFIMPYQMAVVANFSFLAAASKGVYDGTFSYAGYLAFAIIINLLCLAAVYFIFRYLLKIDMSKFSDFDPGKETMTKLTSKQKLSVLLFFVLFILLMVPAFLPKAWAMTQTLNTMGSVGAIMIVIAACCLIRIDDKPFMEFREIVSQNVIWDVLFLFGTALCLITYMSTPDCGVIDWLGGIINPVLTGLSPLVYVTAMLTLCLVLTNLVNNAVVTAILVPLSWGLSVAEGINPVALIACFVCFVDYAIMLPSASPSGAMMYSAGEWLPRKLLYKYGLVSIIVLFVVSLVIGWPLSNVLMPFSV
jgi:sodium-dependent dicarboxylate transporter 2/3/5